MVSKRFFCRLATLLLLAGCFFSCSQHDNNEVIEIIEDIEEPAVNMDKDLLGEWKLVNVSIPEGGETYDYYDNNVVFEFKDDGILKISGVSEIDDPHHGLSDGEYIYSNQQIQFDGWTYPAWYIGWAPVGLTVDTNHRYAIHKPVELDDIHRLQIYGEPMDIGAYYFLIRKDSYEWPLAIHDERIVGKWKNVRVAIEGFLGDFTDYNIIYQFKSDGILVVSGIPEGISGHGRLLHNGVYRYSIVEEEKTIFDFSSKWLILKILNFHLHLNLIIVDFPSESEMTLIEYFATESKYLLFNKIE